MRDAVRETWITGVGNVSALGDGANAHWEARNVGKVNVETAAFAPPLHALCDLQLLRVRRPKPIPGAGCVVSLTIP